MVQSVVRIAPLTSATTLGPISLTHQQKWEDRVTFSPRRTGDRVKVEFLLHVDGGAAPYRSLHLWLRVLPP